MRKFALVILLMGMHWGCSSLHGDDLDQETRDFINLMLTDSPVFLDTYANKGDRFIFSYRKSFSPPKGPAQEQNRSFADI